MATESVVEPSEQRKDEAGGVDPYNMEEALRDSRDVVGTDVMLGNGELWTIPSMPVGPKAGWFVKTLDQYAEATGNEGFDEREISNMVFGFFVRLMQLNYPKMTKENAADLLRAEMVPQVIFIAKGMKALLSMAGSEDAMKEVLMEAVKKQKGE